MYVPGVSAPHDHHEVNSEPPSPAAPAEHEGHGHHGDHAEMVRRLFWLNLALAIPVLVFSEQIQEWFGYDLSFPGSDWIAPVLGTFIYVWGGRPFLTGGLDEAKARQPGMMLLIALAIRNR